MVVENQISFIKADLLKELKPGFKDDEGEEPDDYYISEMEKSRR